MNSSYVLTVMIKNRGVLSMYKMPGIYPLLQTIYHNPPVAEAPHMCYPSISENAVIGESSMVIGDVIVSENVFIGFHNIIKLMLHRLSISGPAPTFKILS
jgi:hypothetical protein